jgi:hypothetical protein
VNDLSEVANSEPKLPRGSFSLKQALLVPFKFWELTFTNNIVLTF